MISCQLPCRFLENSHPDLVHAGAKRRSLWEQLFWAGSFFPPSSEFCGCGGGFNPGTLKGVSISANEHICSCDLKLVFESSGGGMGVPL